ncbi:(d)CMP kinase [Micromonospora cathayae]|uniref:Cytidylate kinase n=1 Tax=Micromonospora cathayae TaxID=3028804 RepID=A0ABY7ZPY5_9ACTN|nr:(d)CMP kinase [Micromonospora sp. HUAS 3]WDZ85069.1 (d)CMP kinase [Micromonospora sp. HUAS 3]
MTSSQIVSAAHSEGESRGALRGVVAIDGPAAAGKSTTARGLALLSGAAYLDTGAIYRAVAWAVLRDGLSPEGGQVADLAGRLDIDISVDPSLGQQVTVDGERVEAQLRSRQVSEAVPSVASHPIVREAVHQIQRNVIARLVASRGGIVVEGRDIGTVVAPEAGLKVFLTASDDERALRRSRQEGVTTWNGIMAVRQALLRRDTRDRNRAVSPLAKAPDAVEVDTTSMTPAEVVDRLVSLADERGMLRLAAHPPVGPDGTPDDGPQETITSPATFRSLFRGHAAGVVVITADAGSGPVGFTATSLSSVSLHPPLVAFALSTSASSWETVSAATSVVVNFLSADQHEIARRFATSHVDRFAAPTSWSRLPSGEPVLDGVPAYLRAVPESRFEAGDHHLVVARAVEARIRRLHLPLIYHAGSYTTATTVL